MRRARATLLLAVAAVVAAWLAAPARARLSREFIYCLEHGACRLESVCAFRLAADLTRCFGETCTNVTGHLMALHNGLNTTVAATWDVLGRSDEPAYAGALSVAGHGVRYFDTHVGDGAAHTVRLAIEGETVDMVLASAAPAGDGDCTADQACDYLLRACYGVTDDPHCVDYALHCHGFAREPGARGAACVQACLATHYGREVAAPYELNITALVAFVARRQAAGAPPAAVFAEAAAAAPPAEGRRDTWTVALIVYAVLATLALLWLGVRQWRARSSRRNIMDMDTHSGSFAM